MKIKYGSNIYIIENNLGCRLFSSLMEEKIDEIELFLYEDIFIQIMFNKLDYYQEPTYLYKALTYFGSDKEQEFIKRLYNKIYKEEELNVENELGGRNMTYYNTHLRFIDIDCFVIKKINQTNYFDFEPLNVLIHNFKK